MKTISTRSKKIRRGDTVVAISGTNKSRSGTVLKVAGDKVLVQGLNMRKKHLKGQGQAKGSIVELEKPIHVSNLVLSDEQGKPKKVKVSAAKSGERQLVYKEKGHDVLHRSLKKA
jgi:large subunit ribosomal protein L24